MVIALLILAALFVLIYFFLQQPQFGSLARSTSLKRIQSSSNYKNGQFQNLSLTPQLTDATLARVMKEFFFVKDKRSKPSVPLPSVKTNLQELDRSEDVLVWFGHSSYFLQIDGKRFLIDPVFSGHASPVTFTTQAFKGSDIYAPEDMPSIDYLLLTHDHYDHLDYETLVQLKPGIKKIITGLGVGAHLQRWGYSNSDITELDWNEEIQLENEWMIRSATARHFSGRVFKRNNSLWMSFVLTTPTMKIFIGGDSGYDTHFKTIGELYGPFDLAILENGQYNRYWKYIHMMPEEVVQATLDLNAKKLLPVHWGKFSLSLHAWDEPIIRVAKEAQRKGVELVHPMIGETLYLKKPANSTRWWEGIS